MRFNNQSGFAIVITMMILAILTLIGTTSLHTSNIERSISTFHQIHEMNFYAADSGAPIASVHLLDSDFLPEADYSNPDWTGTDTMNLSNGTEFTYIVNHQVNSDGDVLRYGDVDGDYLWEINTTHGRPLEMITTNGTHIGRGGSVRIDVELVFTPAFTTPQAALWVDAPDEVDFKGNASVIGDSMDISLCPDVPDVLHHLTPIDPMDEPAHFGFDYVHEPSGGMYPFGPVKNNLSKTANYIGTEFPTDLAEASTADNPVIIIINGDLEINNEDLKVPAYGVLFIDGNLRINGNVEWYGLIISTGNTSIGNGTADITGSLVTGESADVDISGTITIQYDCSILINLFDALSGYRMTSWRKV